MHHCDANCPKFDERMHFKSTLHRRFAKRRSVQTKIVKSQNFCRSFCFYVRLSHFVSREPQIIHCRSSSTEPEIFVVLWGHAELRGSDHLLGFSRLTKLSALS